LYDEKQFFLELKKIPFIFGYFFSKKFITNTNLILQCNRITVAPISKIKPFVNDKGKQKPPLIFA